MIVIRNDAAERLKKLLKDYRKADDVLYELMKPDSDQQQLHQAVKDFRDAERRIAVLIDVFAEEVSEPLTRQHTRIS